MLAINIVYTSVANYLPGWNKEMMTLHCKYIQNHPWNLIIYVSLFIVPGTFF